MRRSFLWSALLAFALAIPLMGASVFAPPIVVVYPITSSGGLDSAVGGNLALAIATRLSQIGGVTVKPPVPGTERAKFLDNALAVGADYYITGFLTPIGVDSSLITQVVSTHSGSVVYSTTAIVKTYADAIAEVDLLQAAVLRHAGRGLAALDAPPPPPSASPDARSGALDIGKALRKRKRGTPKPQPSPSTAPSAAPSAAPAVTAPAVTAPATTARAINASAAPSASASRPPNLGVSASTLLFNVSGTLDAEQNHAAIAALADGFRHVGRSVAILNLDLNDNLARAAALCAGNPGARELAAATIAGGEDETGDVRVQLDLSTYDCTGTLLHTKRSFGTAHKRGGFHDAIVQAARDATLAVSDR